LHARLSAGFLDAVFADKPEVPLNLRGREQAYAPSFQWSALLKYQLNGNLQIQGSFFKQDGYFFDESHDQKATGYSLVDIAVVYSLERAQITFWTKNILNQDYPIRGFYFSNDPNDPLYLPNLFIRSGDPVQVGITLDYLFH
jgi:iron complex outermembrane receptor protein